MKAIILSASPIRPPFLRRGFLLIRLSFLLTCLALCQMVRAVVPAPDGGYPGANTAEGTNALFSLTSGIHNTALGFQALFHNTTGNRNTATGGQALLSNTIGESNTATGFAALLSNTQGNGNTASGYQALLRNTTGIRNTATGVRALYLNTNGPANTATGYQALFSNTTGSQNTAHGLNALYSNRNGSLNTATGVNALLSNTTGQSNTACGVNALRFNTLGSSNTALGTDAGSNVTTANNVICIGHSGDNMSNSCYINNIFGAVIDPGSGIGVGVDSNGKLGTTPSSKRFKEEIKPMDKASEAILALKPVTFHYKSDAKGTPQFGLVAEEVAEVNPDLVVRDKNGEIYTVRYEQINAMLLNEFLKEHRKVEKLEATITQQEKTFQSKLAEQEKKIEALTSGLQRVSAQLEMSKPASKTVLNQ